MTRSSSLLPPALRWAGPFLAAGYGLGARLDRALSTPRPAPLPVICIGNITVGGTGKTPAVKYLARKLVARGRKPAVLLRGYKGQGSDEAAELRASFADLGIPILVGADRLASARLARDQGCDVVVLDDGFQHWRLARDLDIVLIDATDPFGGGRLAPWGRLREGPEALARAGAVVITRADAVASQDVAKLAQELARYAPGAAMARACHKPVCLRSLADGREHALAELRGMAVRAVCGIGNPESFRRLLEQHGASIHDFTAWDDHHVYDDTEKAGMMQAASAGVHVVVTGKDAAKLPRLSPQSAGGIWSLEVAFSFLEGEEAVFARVETALQAGDKRRAG